MATTIGQAVLARFAGSGVTDFSASSGLWFDELPEQLTLPFVGFQMAEESTEYTMEPAYFERGLITFTIFAVTVAEADRLAFIVKAIYDAATKLPNLLTITNARVISWERTGYGVKTADFRNEANSQIGEATFSYSYTVQRSLP